MIGRMPCDDVVNLVTACRRFHALSSLETTVTFTAADICEALGQLPMEAARLESVVVQKGKSEGLKAWFFFAIEDLRERGREGGRAMMRSIGATVGCTALFVGTGFAQVDEAGWAWIATGAAILVAAALWSSDEEKS